MDKEEVYNHQTKENSNQQEILIINYYKFYIFILNQILTNN